MSLPPVLLVEDSEDDIEFARRALARCCVRHPLIIAEEGEEALALLTGKTPSPLGLQPVWPCLILLDLNIPGMSGRELLWRIKTNPLTCTVPVAVLSTSTQAADVEECYRAGANSYHRKPADFRAYEETIRQITNYWLSAVIAPRPSGEILHLNQPGGGWTTSCPA